MTKALKSRLQKSRQQQVPEKALRSSALSLLRPAALPAVLPRNLADALDTESIQARRVTALPKPASELLQVSPIHTPILNCFGLICKCKVIESPRG
jgi:hypothetical protein